MKPHRVRISINLSPEAYTRAAKQAAAASMSIAAWFCAGRGIEPLKLGRPPVKPANKGGKS